MHARNRHQHSVLPLGEDAEGAPPAAALASPKKQAQQQQQQQQVPSPRALLIQMLFVVLLACITFTYSELNFFPPSSTEKDIAENTPNDDDEYVKTTSYDEELTEEKEAPASNEEYLVPCPDVARVNREDYETDLEYVLENFKRTETFSHPFEEIVYVCNAMPPELYKRMVYDFPLIQSMEPAEGGRCSNPGDWMLEKCANYSAAGSNQFYDMRWKLSGYDVIDPENSERLDKSGFRDFESAKETWKRVEQILFSERFQNLVYDKLKLPEEFREKMVTGNVPTDFRLQTDKMGANGYAIGVHPDTPKKLATMQFYLPGLHGGDAKKQESKYGTCVHTAKQFEERDKENNNAAPCERKFGFRENSFYAFKVHETSYHSVERVIDAGERNTLLVNWYRDVPQKLKATKRKRRTKGRGLM